MPISAVVYSCAAIFLVSAIAEAIITRQFRRFLLQVGSLGFVLCLDFFLNIAIRGTTAFGDDDFPVAGIVSISVAAPLGIAARYAFDLQRRRFSWPEFIKPLTITPIVLLPLVGSLQGVRQLKAIQIFSVALLAFQNGFFWQAVLKTAKPAFNPTRRSRQNTQARGGIVSRILLATVAVASICKADQVEIKAQYKPFIVFSSDSRPMQERLLNRIGLTKSDVGMSFALIVGVSHYPQMSSPSKRELPAAAEDVRKLVAYLRDQEYFNEIVVLQDDSVNYENLRYFLEVYFPARLKTPKSRFLFAYSGHGITEGKAPTGYLLKSSAHDLSDKENSINMSVVRDLLGGVIENAHHVLVLINACHSGAFLRQPFGGLVIPLASGAHAITSGGTTEKSWSDETLGSGSIFFEKLLNGLGGAADFSNDGIVTVDELATYLKNQVSAFTDQNQNPRVGDLRLEGSDGSFFFLNRKRLISAHLGPPWDSRNAKSFGADIQLTEFRGKDYSFYYPSDWINMVNNYGFLIPPEEFKRLVGPALTDAAKNLNLDWTPSGPDSLALSPSDSERLTKEAVSTLLKKIGDGGSRYITVGYTNFKMPRPGTPSFTEQPREVGGLSGSLFKREPYVIGWRVRRGSTEFGVVMFSRELDPSNLALFESMLDSVRFY